MAGAGPILLFDKSVLHSLSVDESVWFDTFYFPCITPLFFVETLADLEKEVAEGRSPEDVVGNLAEKTPLGGAINVHHHTLSVAELLGQTLELRRVPAVSGGRSVRAQDGRGAVVYDSPPEAEALERWRDRDFLEVERRFAKDWRVALSRVDLDQMFKQGRAFIDRLGRPRDLPSVKKMAAEVLAKPGSRFVKEQLDALNPKELRDAILKRWGRYGNPPIKRFAPYTAHVLLVDLFFRLALGADLIGRERASNTVDLAYLYYLPFCMAFTSSDRFHVRTASVLMDDGQVFIPGTEMKADLAKLDEHYSRLPEEERAKGLMSFAHYPPTNGEFLVSRMWDQLMRPEWREIAAAPRTKMSKEEEAKIVSEVNALTDAPTESGDPGPDPSAMVIRRAIPFRRGKWQMFSREVLNASRREPRGRGQDPPGQDDASA